MAPPFVFPSNLRDLERDSDGDDEAEPSLRPEAPIAVTTLRAADLEEFVKGASFDLSDKELFCIEEQDVFNSIYSLVRDFTCLPPALKFNLVEALRSNLSVLLPNIDSLSRASMSSPSDGIPITDRIASHRNALKIYSFFLLSIVLTQESSADSGTGAKVTTHGRKKNPVYAWNWEAQRGRIMNLVANSLEVDLTFLFGPGGADERYLSFVSKCTFVLFENQSVLKDEETRKGLCRIVGAIATKHQRISQTSASVLHLIHKYDFTVAYLAEAVAAAEKKFGDGSLAISLVREIGRTDPKDYVRDGTGADNVGRFLVELADRLPKLMSTNLGVLIPHFGGESYKIRNSLVGVLGKLAAKAFKDVDGNNTIRLRSKQAMLEILIERCRDVSAYTRSRVLQVWAELCEENAISIGLWNEVASVASGRLEDKSAIVRKSALQLLITMLQHNPFGPQLRTATFEATLEKYKEKLQSMESQSSEEGEPVNDHPLEEVIVGQDESVSDSCLPSSQDQRDQDPMIADITNLEQIRALVASLEAGLRFSTCIMSLMPILIQLLASSSATDVENTILLLMRCRQFRVEGSEAALRKMLPLVFSQDKSIYEAVESAFISIYTQRIPTETAKSLINLNIDCSIGDLAALENLVSSLVSKGEISSSTMSALWDYFCFNINGVRPVQCRGALSILCMAAKSSPSILGTHLQDIVDIGFGRWAKEEPLLARTACLALHRLSEEDKVKLLSTSTRVFAALQGLITSFSLPEKIWYGATEKAISAIYTLHPAPEIFATEIAKKCLNSVFSALATDGMSNGVELETQNGALVSAVSATKLGRFLFVISHIALNHLVYIETSVKKIHKQKPKNDKSHPTDEGSEIDASKSTEAQGINAELGLGATIDIAVDSLAEQAEREIVSYSCEKNLIGHCGPFLSKLCRNLTVLQKFPVLHASAKLALCILMIIDAEFCEANLQILFTVAETAPSEIVRSNCTIALGDLAVRFPNLLEPWTEHIYARLSDTSASVRKNAVLVISHLILNDMMKVKGYINEMAVRVEDEDERISSLAKLFFHELSKKDVRQWEYISYCLSQLTYTEKGLKKLIDNFKMFEHALSEDSVLNHFRSVIAKCKKFAKPELKVCIEEFEEKVSKVHEEKKEQEATMRNAEAHNQQIGSLDRILVTNEAGQNDGKSAEEEASGEVIDPSVDNNADDKETGEASEAVDPSVENNNAAADKETGEASEAVDPSVEDNNAAADKEAGEASEVADPSVEDNNAEDDEEAGEASEVTGPSVDDRNAEDEEAEEASEVTGPSADDGNAEDKENTPECSENIRPDKSQTSSTCTEAEDGSAEVQSTRKVRRGSSRSVAKKASEPVDSADSAPVVRRSTRSSRRL